MVGIGAMAVAAILFTCDWVVLGRVEVVLLMLLVLLMRLLSGRPSRRARRRRD